MATLPILLFAPAAMLASVAVARDSLATRISYMRRGGIRFLRIGRLNVSFSIARNNPTR